MPDYHLDFKLFRTEIASRDFRHCETRLVLVMLSQASEAISSIQLAENEQYTQNSNTIN